MLFFKSAACHFYCWNFLKCNGYSNVIGTMHIYYIYTHIHNLKTQAELQCIATYNVRTISDEAHLLNLETELENINWISLKAVR